MVPQSTPKVNLWLVSDQINLLPRSSFDLNERTGTDELPPFPPFSSTRLSQVLIQHRAPDEKLRMVERIFASFKSHYVYLSYEEHDSVTANTQAVTHAAFLR